MFSLPDVSDVFGDLPGALVPAAATAAGPAAAWAVCTIAVVAVATWRAERAERRAAGIPRRGRHRMPWAQRARRVLALTAARTAYRA